MKMEIVAESVAPSASVTSTVRVMVLPSYAVSPSTNVVRLISFVPSAISKIWGSHASPVHSSPASHVHESQEEIVYLRGGAKKS
jgi:hypothetical protein